MKLNIRVAEPFEEMKARLQEQARQVDAGSVADGLCGIGFENMAQFGEVFTPKRWKLVETLKTTGPSTIHALAKHLGRHHRNVYQDVAALMEWMVIEKDETDRVFVPWDEIDVRWPLMKRAA